jgi:hypothetical protein
MATLNQLNLADYTARVKGKPVAVYIRKQRFMLKAFHSVGTDQYNILAVDSRGGHWCHHLRPWNFEDVTIVWKPRKHKPRRVASVRPVHADAEERTGEKNDCTVLAVASVLDISYAQAHDRLRLAGRVNRRGVAFGIVARSLGLQDVTSDVFTWNEPLNTLGYLLKAKKLPPRCVVLVHGHAFAVINHVVHDSVRVGTGRRVHGVYAPATGFAAAKIYCDSPVEN